MGATIELVRVGSDARGPLIVLVDGDGHPEDLSACVTSCALARLSVDDWGRNLTPWEAESLYRGQPPYGGQAPSTLRLLEEDLLPVLCQREGLEPSSCGICGYSLAGLFSLWAILNSDTFSAAGALSASVWNDGWVDYLEALDVEGRGRSVFLSLGSKEKRGPRPRLKTVEDRMVRTKELLVAKGFVATSEITSGGHLDHVGERVLRGIGVVDAALFATMER
jgi:predicted alpha/beta superfamily hydrolase